jgi:hypothetical protein
MSASDGPALDVTVKGALCALLARLFASEPDPVLYQQLRDTGGPGLTWFEPE